MNIKKKIQHENVIYLFLLVQTHLAKLPAALQGLEFAFSLQDYL